MYAMLLLCNPKNDNHYMTTNHVLLLVYTNNVLAPNGDEPWSKVYVDRLGQSARTSGEQWILNTSDRRVM